MLQLPGKGKKPQLVSESNIPASVPNVIKPFALFSPLPFIFSSVFTPLTSCPFVACVPMLDSTY